MRNHTLRGGKTMAFSSPDGAQHEASFWVLDRLAVDIPDQAARLKFVGYHSTAAYDEDKQPVAGAVKEYLASGEAFAAAIAMPTLGQALPIGTEIIRLAWTVALATLDTQGEGEMVSFFGGAVDAV
jgi:hypothetical protein